MASIPRRFSSLMLAVLVGLAIQACQGAAAGEGSAAAPPPPASSPAAETTDPRYTDERELIRPSDFHTWVFVGSNVGLGYSERAMALIAAEGSRNQPIDAASLGHFHNVYMKPEDYEHYITNKTFPERTVLVMDRYVAQQKEPQGIVDRGFFDGAPSGIEVAVKNSHRPDGSDTDWAYYSFDLANGQMPDSAPAHPDSMCYDCHKVHGDFDNVWVQFYPVIRGVNPPQDAAQAVR